MPHSERFPIRHITLHGRRMAYRTGGDGGPVILLVHGLAGNSGLWIDVMAELSRRYTVVAPDLLGHGDSAKPRGDYSLGAQACFLRDLLVALGHDRTTIVGHSLGGGISMQFAYQFPEHCERLVLLNSGGLGTEVSFILRAPSLPLAEYVTPLVLHRVPHEVAGRAVEALGRFGLRLGPAQSALWDSWAGLTDPETRRAFVETVRAVIDRNGQRVSASDRLYLAETMPTMIMWGDNDRIIPVSHAVAAHRAMKGSRLEIVAGTGHFLPVEDPERVATVLTEFMERTQPADQSREALRERLLSGGRRSRTPSTPPRRRGGEGRAAGGHTRTKAPRGVAAPKPPKALSGR